MTRTPVNVLPPHSGYARTGRTNIVIFVSAEPKPEPPTKFFENRKCTFICKTMRCKHNNLCNSPIFYPLSYMTTLQQALTTLLCSNERAGMELIMLSALMFCSSICPCRMLAGLSTSVCIDEVVPRRSDFTPSFRTSMVWCCTLVRLRSVHTPSRWGVRL